MRRAALIAALVTGVMANMGIAKAAPTQEVIPGPCDSGGVLREAGLDLVCNLVDAALEEGIETPDDDDFLDLVENFLPEGMFDGLSPVDPGGVNDDINGLLAPVPDEWDIVAGLINPILLRSCSIGASGPSKTRSGTRLFAFGVMTCLNKQANMAIEVCIDVFSGGHWNQVKCDHADSANQPKVDEGVSVPCAPPGTYDLRARVTAAAIGKNGDPSAGLMLNGNFDVRCF